MPVTIRPAILAAGLLFTGTTLDAHVPDLVPPERLWSSWTFEPLILASLTTTTLLYTRGIRRLWVRAGRGRVVSSASVLSFSAGIAVLIVALVSPLDSLGGTLLSAHMAQHGLLAGIAPPLLLMGRPGVVFAWGLQPLWSAATGVATAWRWMAAAGRRLSAPALATAVHGVLLWVWHAPALFNAAVEYHWVHALQHMCFFLPSFFFWRALLDGESARRAHVPMLASFLTFMHTGLLGGLLTMAPAALYPVYFGRTDVWGHTALDDQQIAGLVMWVPLGLPYLAAGVWLASRALTLDPPMSREAQP